MSSTIERINETIRRIKLYISCVFRRIQRFRKVMAMSVYIADAILTERLKLDGDLTDSRNFGILQLWAMCMEMREELDRFTYETTRELELIRDIVAQLQLHPHVRICYLDERVKELNEIIRLIMRILRVNNIYIPPCLVKLTTPRPSSV